jgi:hypothetical protein
MTHDRFLILTILLLTPPASAADAHNLKWTDSRCCDPLDWDWNLLTE